MKVRELSSRQAGASWVSRALETLWAVAPRSGTGGDAVQASVGDPILRLGPLCVTLRPADAKRWSSDGFLMKSIPSPRSSCTLVLDRFVAPLTSEAVSALAGARAWPGRSTVEPR